MDQRQARVGTAGRWLFGRHEACLPAVQEGASSPRGDGGGGGDDGEGLCQSHDDFFHVGGGHSGKFSRSKAILRKLRNWKP